MHAGAIAGRPVPLPPRVIVVGALGAAGLIGVGIAGSPPVGVAMLLVAGFVPLALLNLPLALATWIPLVFVMRLGLFSVAPLAGLMLLVLAWFGTLRRHNERIAALLALHARTFALAGALLLWLALSAAWAADADEALNSLWYWLAAAAVLVLTATAGASRERARLLAGAFVIGAILSVLVGLIGLDPQVPDSALQTASEGRFTGGSADPNYLAAGLIPAVLLLSGLVRRRVPVRNLALLAAAALLTLGLAATESRGGLIAAGVAVLGALAFFRGRRPYVVILVVALASVAAAWFSVSPEAWERVTTFDEGGNGRTDLWQVAWRMTADHPVAGVGLNNFVVEAKEYVRQPGSLEFVNLIAERPHVAHNTYLQFLAETGVIGLALFLALLGASLRAAWLSAQRFTDQHDHEMAALARATLVAVLAAGASSFFISNGDDWRLWVLLGLGPALLGASRAAPTEQTRAG